MKPNKRVETVIISIAIGTGIILISSIILFMQWLSWNGPEWIMMTSPSRYDQIGRTTLGFGTILGLLIIIGGIIGGIIATLHIILDD